MASSGTTRARPRFRAMQTSSGTSKNTASTSQPYCRAILTYGRALSGRQVRGIHIGHGPANGQPLPQQVTDRSEDAPVDGLVGGVVGQQLADGIG